MSEGKQPRKTGADLNPNGRPKGVPNKATQNAREAIARFVDGNTHRLEGWLDEIAKESPLQAFKCLSDVLEYHVPKLNRTEVTGLNGGPIVIEVDGTDTKL